MKRQALLGAVWTLLGLALLLSYSAPFAAETFTYRKTVGAFSVYLAVMPGELVRGPQPAGEPAATPFQEPAAKDTHHLMVSIFESRTGRRMTNATVKARVAALGFSGVKKPLENTTVMGEQVYANLFPMQGRGPFKVDTEFHTADSTRREHATFYFTHPNFGPPKRASKKQRAR